MDKFEIKINRGRKRLGQIIRINQKASDALNELLDEYDLGNSTCQLVSDMILFCIDRAELVEED